MSETVGWCGTKPDGSSSAPSIAGTLSSTQSAPGPHASAWTAPSYPWRSRSVATPSGLRMPRQTVPSGSVR